MNTKVLGVLGLLSLTAGAEERAARPARGHAKVALAKETSKAPEPMKAESPKAAAATEAKPGTAAEARPTTVAEAPKAEEKKEAAAATVDAGTPAKAAPGKAKAK